MSTEFETELLASLPRLRATAMMFTRNRAAADDLVQDSLLRALVAQDSYALGTNLGAWLYRLMRNRFISGLRLRRIATLSLDEPEAISIGAPGNQEDHLAGRELERELAKLPTAQREAVLLIGASGLSYEEAALAMSCGVGTVKSRVSRARATLRLRLDRAEPTHKEEIGEERHAPDLPFVDEVTRRAKAARIEAAAC
ncbi:MAG: sigma-70 family RNA polymerase sigma factor [Elsteraceae bacterium]